MTDATDTCPATNRDGEPCGLSAGWGTDTDSGPCKFHGGAGGTSPDGSSHEGNDWAAKHGAYSESFVEDFLTDAEKAMVEQAQDVFDTPEGAKENAKLMAAITQMQFRRTGDERFLRRYESICDTFGIAPADEVDVSGELDLGGELVIDFEETDT